MLHGYGIFLFVTISYMYLNTCAFFEYSTHANFEMAVSFKSISYHLSRYPDRLKIPCKSVEQDGAAGQINPGFDCKFLVLFN